MSSAFPKTNKHSELIAATGIAGFFIALTLIVNYGVLSGNWRWDDPAILLHIHKFSIFDDFGKPEIWQQFSPANLTPWLSLSFEVDLILFGLRPELFYLHQLVSLALVSIALYLCLTLWVTKRLAFVGALFFSLSTPALLVAQQLMTRHYIEGAVFCLLSLYCFVLFLRTSKSYLLLCSGLFYMLAVTAKEIYVPLLILYLFLPEGLVRKRVKATIPFALIALVYVVWRGYMLNSLAGGYTSASDYLNIQFLGQVASTFLQFPRFLFGSLSWLVSLLYLILVVTYFVFCNPRMLTSAVVLALCLLPLVPLVQFPGIAIADRYLFLVALIFSFSVAFYSERISTFFNSQGKSGLLGTLYTCIAIMLIAGFVNSLNIRQQVSSIADEFDAQAGLLLNETSNVAFIPSAHVLSSYWFISDLAEFKSRLFVEKTSPISIVDEIYLSEGQKSLLVYSTECACMREADIQVQEILATHRSKLNTTAPLELEFEYQSGVFEWNFGPYEDGEYHVVSDVLGILGTPGKGRMRVNLADNSPFYLRYTSPDSWITYSSIQHIRHNAPVTNWQRE
jgi:hypothetical protein